VSSWESWRRGSAGSPTRDGSSPVSSFANVRHSDLVSMIRSPKTRPASVSNGHGGGRIPQLSQTMSPVAKSSMNDVLPHSGQMRLTSRFGRKGSGICEAVFCGWEDILCQRRRTCFYCNGSIYDNAEAMSTIGLYSWKHLRVRQLQRSESASPTRQ
jgi:hypothetical protein